MGYVEHNLLPGEEIIYRGKLHWGIYAAPAFFGIVGLLLIGPSLGHSDLLPLAWIGSFFLVAAAIFALSRWITFKTSEFAVTNKRVIIKVGFIRRDTVELLLAKVESIGVDQAILGRIFNYGTIVVVGTGGTKEPFKRLARPLEFRRQVQAQAAGND